jgi:hypothetical protein
MNEQMNGKQHYSEADLLETYYLQPGQSMPVMMHLARCTDCAARYERLERKLRQAASCQTNRPETFWARQRHTIMRSIGARRQRSVIAVAPWRAVAAAALTFILGGTIVYQTENPPAAVAERPATVAGQKPPGKRPTPARAAPNDELLLHDAWQSDELKQFHDVVAWEKWTDSKPQPDEAGDTSL